MNKSISFYYQIKHNLSLDEHDKLCFISLVREKIDYWNKIDACDYFNNENNEHQIKEAIKQVKPEFINNVIREGRKIFFRPADLKPDVK